MLYSAVQRIIGIISSIDFHSVFALKTSVYDLRFIGEA